ncbi:MAG: Uracil phosphoribosyltransferase [Bacteroidota bacterium]
MIVHNLGEHSSLLNRFIAELRDVKLQQDAMRFRRNIERIGEVLGYEISKILPSHQTSIQTPLGVKTMEVPQGNLVLCAVLRAGLPLQQGLLNYFDQAQNAFVSAYRQHPEGSDYFEVVIKYLAAPSLEGKTVLIADPMLATGLTLENVLNALRKHGEPAQIHIVSVIGSTKGIEQVARVYPEGTQLWIAAVDDELNARGYIVPGLGDAGDLAFGEKL